MLTPILLAEPAVTGFALGAIHVITALIFLYVTLTFRTWFCIGFQPGQVLGICLFLLQPQLQVLAACGNVLLLLAVEAVDRVAVASYCAFECIFRFFDDSSAANGRAPYHIFVTICILLRMPVHIFFIVVGTTTNAIFLDYVLQILQEEGVRYNHITPKLWTF